MAKFEGIITALITPFTKDGNIYEEGIRNEIKYLAQHGINNVFICGSYGAFPIMTTDDRKLVAKISVDECKKYNMKSIVHIGSTSTKIAVELAEHSESIGADAISAVVPFYYSTTFYNDTNYICYFKSILCSVSIDVHCYNNVKTTGVNISPKLLEKLIGIGIKGIKDGGSDMAAMLKMLNLVDVEEFDYYPSSTSSLITGFLLGVKACVSGVSLTVPDLITSIYLDIHPSISKQPFNIDRALRTWEKVMKVRSMLGQFKSRAISTYNVLNYKGIDVGNCIEPWIGLDSKESKVLIENLKSVGVV